MNSRVALLLSLMLICAISACAAASAGSRFDVYAVREFEQRRLAEGYQIEFMTGFRYGLTEVAARRYRGEPEDAEVAQREAEACDFLGRHNFSDEHQERALFCGYAVARQAVLENNVQLSDLGYTPFRGAARLGAKGGFEPPFLYFLSINDEEVHLNEATSWYLDFDVGDCFIVEGYLSGEGVYGRMYRREIITRNADKVDASICNRE